MQKTVLHLARRSAPDIGGVESHLSQLTPEVEKLGYHSNILNEAMLLEQWSWLPSHKLAIWLGMIAHLPALVHASIIHVHDVFWWLLPFLPLLWRKRIYITFHGYESVAGPSFRQRFWHRLAAHLTKGNICIGQFHESWYGVKPNATSYGAVTVVEKAHRKPRSAKVVFVGRLAPDTGFRLYLEAVRLIQERGGHIELDVFGEGSERPWAEAYCKLHALPVHFFGFVPNAQLRIGEYSCVFASQYLAILESLAVGVPIIACATTLFKQAYLRDTPFASWIAITTTPEKIMIAYNKHQPLSTKASIWIRSQTWTLLAQQYDSLWSSR